MQHAAVPVFVGQRRPMRLSGRHFVQAIRPQRLVGFKQRPVQIGLAERPAGRIINHFLTVKQRRYEVNPLARRNRIDQAAVMNLRNFPDFKFRYIAAGSVKPVAQIFADFVKLLCNLYGQRIVRLVVHCPDNLFGQIHVADKTNALAFKFGQPVQKHRVRHAANPFPELVDVQIRGFAFPVAGQGRQQAVDNAARMFLYGRFNS